ncbi:AbrB/MazE/SpoVT family DNA-binding domain-containing protein [Acidianus ambivalens]|uniref:AbrB/MazE/SpoVT family DNA-binding domain-containing protein n=1 Tax=Acidianus ambivalens TaxID=2283 RepID=A0A650CWA4_ACIAM|nr:AbrB/MazE/SpoVT family DNA-binding domain-containing protein [Acidianus ambivalens]MQL54216.1 AbrB/MazE/SpoVT family DNA-binding domain-containing protein [Acidianus ambivalens]QGR22048.1 AbrB/MazE/SpoVT family DNA-binding domain-containing protein [Acidianus ambivalens]
MKIKVTSNFQITIPLEVREKLGIKEGDFVDSTLDEKEGIIIVKPYRRKWTTVRFNRTITQEDIDNSIEEALNNNNS